MFKDNFLFHLVLHSQIGTLCLSAVPTLEKCLTEPNIILKKGEKHSGLLVYFFKPIKIVLSGAKSRM